MKVKILLLSLSGLLFACSSTSSAKGDKDYLADARLAILRAEAVDARSYSTAEMTLADDYYNNGESLKNNGQAFKGEAINSKKEADKAYEKSLPYFKEQIKLNFDSIIEKLEAVDLPKYNKDSYDNMVEEVSKSKALVDDEPFDAIKIRNEYSKQLASGRNLRKILSTNKKLVSEERELFINYRGDLPETANAEDVKLMNELFDSAEQNEQDFNLEAAYEGYQLAKLSLRNIVDMSGNVGNIEEVDALLRSVQEAIEGAHVLYVENENGDLINPEAWSGEAFLADNPLIVFDSSPKSISEAIVADKDSLKKLKPYSTSAYPENGEVEKPDSSEASQSEAGADVAYFDSSKTLVAGDSDTLSLYSKAIELWQEGVKSRNNQDIEEAKDYFEQANEYITEFKRGSVRQIYTVQLRPSARDCLWRISAMKNIYGNAYLWPLIWQRNQKKITNPDRIYPGQQLMIPPLMDETTAATPTPPTPTTPKDTVAPPNPVVNSTNPVSPS